jgi:hypothetical protein
MTMMVLTPTSSAISEALFDTLEAEEKKSWHPHNYELLSGQLVLPSIPDVAEKAALAKKINSYGKTWARLEHRPRCNSCGGSRKEMVLTGASEKGCKSERAL